MRYSERKIRNGKVCAGLFAAAFSVLFFRFVYRNEADALHRIFVGGCAGVR